MVCQFIEVYRNLQKTKLFNSTVQQKQLANAQPCPRELKELPPLLISEITQHLEIHEEDAYNNYNNTAQGMKINSLTFQKFLMISVSVLNFLGE